MSLKHQLVPDILILDPNKFDSDYYVAITLDPDPEVSDPDPKPVIPDL